MRVANNYWKRRLGRELSDLRAAAGLRQEDAGAFVERTQPRITQIERGTGKGIVDLALLRALATCYNATPATLARLLRLRDNAKKSGWVDTYDLPGWLADYVRLEADAALLRESQLELIPGLLQTADYARALHRLRDIYSDREVNHRVEIRMQRQKRLTGQDPLRLETVVSEAALLRCLGCGDMGRAQLHQLADRAQWPNVDLRVIPLRSGLHVSLTGMFVLLDFPDDLMPPMVYQEYPVGGHLIDAADVVSQMLTLFSELRGLALGADESLVLLAELC